MTQEKTREERKAELRKEREAELVTSSSGNGSGKRVLIPFQPGRYFTSTGRRADYMGSDHAVQRVAGFSLEGIDYKSVRNSTHRLVTNYPEYGRSSQGPAAHVRRKSPFWMIPAKHVDTLLFPKWNEETYEFEMVQILQPQHYQTIERTRAWALWAPNGGPFSIYLTAEKRDLLLSEFPYFRMRADHRHDLIRDAYAPTADDMLRAMNPELVEVETPSHLSSDELYRLVKERGGIYTDWFYMNVTLQGTFLEYQNLMIGKGAIEHGLSFDPYMEMDPHLNERHCSAFNAMQKLVTDEYGTPKYVYVATGQVGSETEEGEAEGPQALYRNLELTEPRLKPLVQGPEDATSRYQKIKPGYHSRFDFNPHPDVCRDLWGRSKDKDGNPLPRDPEHGIIPDIERMSEVMYLVGREEVSKPLWGGDPRRVLGLLGALFQRRKTRELNQERPPAPNYTFGPSHSATDLLLEMPVEEEVIIGKRISAGKRGSQQERENDLGQLNQKSVETAASNWWGGHTPAMAKSVRSDALKMEEHHDFWSNFRKKHLNGFLAHRMFKREMHDLVSEAPTPKDFWKLIEHAEYFKFDPTDASYGYDFAAETGIATPRVPDGLIRILIRDPDDGGLNFTGLDGTRILTSYYESSDQDRDNVKNFWLHKVPAALQDEQWEKLEAKHGLDYLVMAYAFWKPEDEPGSVAKGLIPHMYRSQPIMPVIYRLRGVWNKEVIAQIVSIRPVLYKEVVKELPWELIKNIGKPAGEVPEEDILAREIQHLNRQSDTRVRTKAGFLSHGKEGHFFSFTFSDAKKEWEDGYGSDNGLPEADQQARPEDLLLWGWTCEQTLKARNLARALEYHIFHKHNAGEQHSAIARALGGGLDPGIADEMLDGLGGFAKLLAVHGEQAAAIYVKEVFSQKEITQIGERVIREVIEKGKYRSAMRDMIIT